LDYNPATGIFTHKVNYPGIGGKIGKVAGHLNNKGYICIGLGGKSYKAHRLAFLYMTGSFPEEQVDHIDGNKANNRWENLRKASSFQNMQNKPSRTKYEKGVYFAKKLNKYVVCLSFFCKRKVFGYFSDLELAELVSVEAQDKYHKEFMYVS
jgi:hypothetical protein